MTSQLLLVIVVGAAGIVIAAVVFLRAHRARQSENTTADSSAGDMPDLRRVTSPASAGNASEIEFTLGHACAPAAAAAPAPPAGGRVSTRTTPSGTPQTLQPAEPRVLQPPEVFAKLFDLALGKG